MTELSELKKLNKMLRKVFVLLSRKDKGAEFNESEVDK